MRGSNLRSRATSEKDEYSVAMLRRSLRSLSSATRWSALRSSQQSLVESLRKIAEVVVWGDQHDSNVFLVFRTEAGLEKMARVLKKKSNRRGPVAEQLLKTCAMLVQNVKEKSSLHYVLNHEATRQIISADFDLNDEEVVAYYVSFVRSISFNLNEATVNSFMKKISPKSDVFSMPLFVEAAKFTNSAERMVRSVARTLTLNIMSMKNNSVDSFLVSNQNQAFYKTQVHILKGKIDEVNALSKKSTRMDTQTRNEVQRLLAEIEDVIAYLNDIYTYGSKEVQKALANAAWDEMLGQHLIFPLFEAMNKQLSERKNAQSLSEEGYPLLKLPNLETLASIASEWVPFPETGTIYTTFVASTLNVLLSRSDFVYSRVIMQLINQAFTELEKSTQNRLIPLLNIDLETHDLNEEPEWRIEATKIDTKMKLTVGPTIGLLEFADYIGLGAVLDVLKVLYRQTRCAKYRPSSLLVALQKNPRAMFKGRRFIPFSPSVKQSISTTTLTKTSHRRQKSVVQSCSRKARQRTSSF